MKASIFRTFLCYCFFFFVTFFACLSSPNNAKSIEKSHSSKKEEEEGLGHGSSKADNLFTAIKRNQLSSSSASLSPTLSPSSTNSNDLLASLSCPSLCFCGFETSATNPGFTSLKTDCSNKSLQLIPKYISGNTSLLLLSSNGLRWIQKEDFQGLERLRTLILEDNLLEEIPEDAFYHLISLQTLNLSKNRLKRIHENSFARLSSLLVLEINNNKLNQLPVAVTFLSSLRELLVANNNIGYIPSDIFSNNVNLENLVLKGNRISRVGETALTNLRKLKTLILSESPHLTTFPNLSNLVALEQLSIDRGSIEYIPGSICDWIPNLKALIANSNRLSRVPILEKCGEMRVLDISYNNVQGLEENDFRKQEKMIDLFLSYNQIKTIPRGAFIGLSSLKVLDMEGNGLLDIHEEAFSPLVQLKDLNLAHNQIKSLPTKGLQNLRKIKTFGNPHLLDFPPPERFPQIETLALSYAYHCCPYMGVKHEPPKIEDNVVWLEPENVDMSIWNTNASNIWLGLSNNISSRFEKLSRPYMNGLSDVPQNIFEYDGLTFEDMEDVNIKYAVKCIPKPSPFMPCEDLFDWWTLRCGVWLVFLLALLGNGVVVVVLIFGRSKLDVPRFLVCNLAMADFFMGIYLGMLTVVDAATLGEFKIYGLPWQMSWACELAGFLGVLSSELSVYTLAVITMERNYAITHAMHLNKRLSLKHASYIMSVGWTFALSMATLPLFGISDYRKFAVCLPFEVKDVGSMSYVITLMVINGIAFLILMGCYLRMYCAIRGSQAWNSNDSRIAKRMALLVFTDFLCWAPIAFFSLTAISGLHLISLSQAKIFTVFILPLNSCANPFLYAIFTKQFKKECVMLCKRIEESRVTRGIGRCRHSSNFSNRHTPLNTNSAVEKRSEEWQQPVCQCGVSAAKASVDSEILNPSRKPSKIKKIAIKWFWKKKLDSGILSSIDSGYPSGNPEHFTGHSHKRGNSISSENFSSRSDSWRHGQVPLRLLQETNKALGLQRRRSSWAASSSTSTMRISTTRSSVSSDSSVIKSLPPHHVKAVRNLSKQQDRAKSLARARAPFPNQFLCPDCSKKEVLRKEIGKEKDLDKKFHQFFNKLSESSQDDASESKEDHVIVSSGESNKAETAETSLQDSIGTDSQPENAIKPSVDVRQFLKQSPCTLETHIENDPETDKSGLLPGNSSSRASSNISIRTQIPLSTDSRCLGQESKISTHSLTSICSNVSSKSKRLVKRRKVASDNSLKTSLRNIPAMFKSFSSQSSSTILGESMKFRGKQRQKHYHHSTGDVYLFKGCEAKTNSTDPSDSIVDVKATTLPKRSKLCRSGMDCEVDIEFHSETSCDNGDVETDNSLSTTEEDGLVKSRAFE